MKVVQLRIGEESEVASQRITKKTSLKQGAVLRMAIECGLPLVEEALLKLIPSHPVKAKSK